MSFGVVVFFLSSHECRHIRNVAAVGNDKSPNAYDMSVLFAFDHFVIATKNIGIFFVGSSDPQ